MAANPGAGFLGGVIGIAALPAAGAATAAVAAAGVVTAAAAAAAGAGPGVGLDLPLLVGVVPGSTTSLLAGLTIAMIFFCTAGLGAA
jgi:hypothetical protein